MTLPNATTVEHAPKPGGRVVIYARVSTDRQRADGTIAGQVEVLREIARANRMMVVEECLDDGVSGTVPPTERPGCRQVLSLVDRGEVDVVLVRDLDRLSRDPSGVHLPLFRKALRDAGVALWTRTGEAKDDTPESQLMQNMLGALAAYERGKIRERTREGRRRSIRNGGRPRGTKLVGYDWDSDAGQLVVNEVEAALIREVFRLAAEENMRPFTISRNLKTRGLKAGRKTYLVDTSIEGILKREAYWSGDYHPEPNEMPDLLHKVPPIVDRQMWEHANMNREANRRPAPKRANLYSFLLRGLVQCHHCGRPMRAQCARGRYPYYRCEKGVTAPLNQQQCQARKGIRADHVDEAVWKVIVRLLSEPGALRDEIEKMVSAEVGSVERLKEQAASVRAELTELDAKLDRLVDAVAEGILPLDAVRQKRAVLDEARRPLERRLQVLTAQTMRASADGARLAVVEQRMKDIRAALPTMTAEQREVVARELLTAVHIDTMTRDITIEALVLFDGDDGDDGPAPSSGSGGSLPTSGDSSGSCASDVYGTRSTAT